MLGSSSSRSGAMLASPGSSSSRETAVQQEPRGRQVMATATEAVVAGGGGAEGQASMDSVEQGEAVEDSPTPLRGVGGKRSTWRCLRGQAGRLK